MTRIDAFWLGFAVQLPLFAAATASFYTVIARRWDEQTAALSLALLLASPASVFCSAHDRELVPAAYGAVCADAGT